MFLGTYTLYFSGKNRLILPKKFRKELGSTDTFYLVRGIDGEIWGLNSEQWQKEAAARLIIPLDEERGRRLRRKFFPLATECGLDHQGRFILPQELVDYAQIKGNVILIGAGDHFEIWEPKMYLTKTEV